MNDAPARFIIEETGFNEVCSSETITSKVEAFCALIAAIHKCPRNIQRHSQLEYVDIIRGIPLVDIMYGAHSGILSRDLKNLLISAINRCSHWDDGSSEEPTTLSADNISYTSATLTCAFNRSIPNLAISCIGLEGCRLPTGWHDVTRLHDNRSSALHFIRRSSQLQEFFRRLIDRENCNPEQFIELAPLAFPDLYLLPSLTQQFSAFDEGYQSVRTLVIQHLSALNDHFRNIIQRHHGLPSAVGAELRSLAGVEASPENANTHNNKHAMRAREVIVEGKTVVCEWHTKLRPHVDRIHFNPGNINLVGGRIIVGIFAAHLPT